MNLYELLSIIFVILAIWGTFLSVKDVMSINIPLEVFKIEGINIAKLLSLVQQKVDTFIGFILVVISLIGDHFSRIDKFKKIRVVKSKKVGNLIAIFIAAIIIVLCLVLASILNHNIGKETKMNVAQTLLKGRFLTEEKVTDREFLDTVNDAKTLFGIERNKNEPKIEFLRRYTIYLGLKFPRNVNLSELKDQ